MKTLLLLLFTTFLALPSCKEEEDPRLALDTDFPKSEQIDFKKVNTYNQLFEGMISIKDSVIWCMTFGASAVELGSCYNINSGEKISTIITKGKANYEIVRDSPVLDFIEDSVQFSTSKTGEIKTFAIKDIVEDKPIGSRDFSITQVPDSIHAYRIHKLPNNTTLATILPKYYYNLSEDDSEINKGSVLVYKNNSAVSYQSIPYDSFNIKDKQIDDINTTYSKIKLAYTNGKIKSKDNKTAVFTVADQFILYTFDIEGGKVLKEKRYSKFNPKNPELRNDIYLSINRIETSNNHIVCIVSDRYKPEGSSKSIFRETVYIFDWDLNPIKRIELPSTKSDEQYLIDSDCKAIFRIKFSEEGMILHRADLNI